MVYSLDIIQNKMQIERGKFCGNFYARRRQAGKIQLKKNGKKYCHI